MSDANVWKSPDGRIEKRILNLGAFGKKPTENSKCSVRIESDRLDLVRYNETPIVIGDVFSQFDMLLHNCLQTMCVGEKALVTVKTKEQTTELTIELLHFKSTGLIYEWDAATKYRLAVDHKTKGVDLFKGKSHVAASYRFGKALKILCSIPLDAQDRPTQIDGLSVKDLTDLKGILYSNLANCFLINKDYETTIRLCEKSLAIDGKNVKSLYRCGTAYLEDHAYETAIATFKRLIEIEPDNKAAKNMLMLSEKKLVEANARVDCIIKKMFI